MITIYITSHIYAPLGWLPFSQNLNLIKAVCLIYQVQFNNNQLFFFALLKTIFEINSTSKKQGLEVMKAKRSQHEHIIMSNEAKLQEQLEEKLEKERELSEESLQMSLALNPSSKKKRKSEDADQDEIDVSLMNVTNLAHKRMQFSDSYLYISYLYNKWLTLHRESHGNIIYLTYSIYSLDGV